jgi:hypothetical protein
VAAELPPPLQAEASTRATQQTRPEARFTIEWSYASPESRLREAGNSSAEARKADPRHPCTDGGDGLDEADIIPTLLHRPVD